MARARSRHSMAIGLDISALSQLGENLEALKPSTQARIIADAAGRAAAPIVKRAKSLVRVDSGDLRKSLGHLVRKYPKQGKVIALIGARRGYYKQGRRLRSGEKTEGADSPARRSHLLEFGTRTARPRPFLRPAVESKRAEADRILGEGFALAIEAEHKRVLRKVTKRQKP